MGGSRDISECGVAVARVRFLEGCSGRCSGQCLWPDMSYKVVTY